MSRTPSYKRFRSTSAKATRAARGASKKRDTKCEVVLRQHLWRAGCRYRKDVKSLPGRPDVIFSKAKVAVFCDGDFWHGRDWEQRRLRLQRGSNPKYWVQKIERNMERDRQQEAELIAQGWTVVRLWETDILRDAESVAAPLLRLLRERAHLKT